jgi:DNA-binding CsgD family transcriptional regulator
MVDLSIGREELAMKIGPQMQRVLAAVAQGKSNAEIAQELGVTVNTVKTHLCRFSARLPGKSTRVAVALAWARNTWSASRRQEWLQTEEAQQLVRLARYLTVSEMAILDIMVAHPEFTTAQIAHTQSCSDDTIKTHLRRAKMKLHAVSHGSRAGMVVWWYLIRYEVKWRKRA